MHNKGGEMMIIKMVGLYGIEDQKAYFRKIGDGCFDFVSDKKFASYLKEDEAKRVMDNKDWYLKQYNAEFIYTIKRG